MTHAQALAHAQHLLMASDAMLAGCVQMISQLREAIQILSQSVPLPSPSPQLPSLREPEGTAPTNGHPGNLTLNELHSHLSLAGVALSKTTLNQYACLGSIPCSRAPDGKRRFNLTQVLDALASRPRCNSKPRLPSSSPPSPS